MDDISYLLDCVHNILDVLNRVEGVHNGHGDVQLLVCKVDFLQRTLVNLDIDRVRGTCFRPLRHDFSLYKTSFLRGLPLYRRALLPKN